jgi:cell division protein ZapB
MEPELLSLEGRVREVAELCARLREENQTLRQRVASLENEKRLLQGKIDAAASRLEHLLAAQGAGASH